MQRPRKAWCNAGARQRLTGADLFFTGVYLMDNYSEQLVAKIRTTADTVKIATVIILAALIAGACVFLALATGFLLLIFLGVGILFFGIWLVSGMGIEYEYIITNTEMDIDKIIGKRKRKRMITVDLTKAEEFAPLNGESPDCDVIVHASSGSDTNIHYLIVEHSDYGKVKIFFNPGKKFTEALKLAFPAKLRIRMEN